MPSPLPGHCPHQSSSCFPTPIKEVPSGNAISHQPMLLPGFCSPTGTGTPNPTVWVASGSRCPPGPLSRECGTEVPRGCRILLLSLISWVTRTSSAMPQFPQTIRWGQRQISPSTTSRGLPTAGAELIVPWPYGETEAWHSKAGLGGPELICAPTAPSTPAALISCSFLSLQPDSPGTTAAERPSPVMLY